MSSFHRNSFFPRDVGPGHGLSSRSQDVRSTGYDGRCHSDRIGGQLPHLFELNKCCRDATLESIVRMFHLDGLRENVGGGL
jgi:hypothetical protein